MTNNEKIACYIKEIKINNILNLENFYKILENYTVASLRNAGLVTRYNLSSSEIESYGKTALIEAALIYDSNINEHFETLYIATLKNILKDNYSHIYKGYNLSKKDTDNLAKIRNAIRIYHENNEGDPSCDTVYNILLDNNIDISIEEVTSLMSFLYNCSSDTSYDDNRGYDEDDSESDDNIKVDKYDPPANIDNHIDAEAMLKQLCIEVIDQLEGNQKQIIKYMCLYDHTIEEYCKEYGIHKKSAQKLFKEARNRCVFLAKQQLNK